MLTEEQIGAKVAPRAHPLGSSLQNCGFKRVLNARTRRISSAELLGHTASEVVWLITDGTLHGEDRPRIYLREATFCVHIGMILLDRFTLVGPLVHHVAFTASACEDTLLEVLSRLDEANPSLIAAYLAKSVRVPVAQQDLPRSLEWLLQPGPEDAVRLLETHGDAIQRYLTELAGGNDYAQTLAGYYAAKPQELTRVLRLAGLSTMVDLDELKSRLSRTGLVTTGDLLQSLASLVLD